MRTVGDVINTICYIETLLIVGRVLISWFPGIDYGNPLVRALCAVTDPVLRIFRPILPTFAGIDVSPILAIVVLRIIGNAFVDLAAGVLDPLQVALDILAQVILAVILIMVIVVFLRVVLSLFQADPWHPATRMVREMSRPLLGPFGGLRSRSRHVDVPAIVALAVYIAAYFVVRRIFDEIIIRV